MFAPDETLPRLDKTPTDLVLSGKTALVTGSTSGIGLAIAKALSFAGANIVLNGFGDKDQIRNSLQSLTDKDGRATYSPADMSRPDEINDMIMEAKTMFGNVDILINNAGIQHVAPVETFPPSKWDDILAINLSSAFHTSRAVFHDMRENGWGRIINIASAHGLIASPYKSAYVAAKHGIVGLTKVLALEGAEAGITANAICPGYVWTPLVEKQIQDQAEAHGISEDEVISSVLLKNTPTKKFAQPEEIAELCLFLCGAGGNSITGQALPVDGGWTAH